MKRILLSLGIILFLTQSVTSQTSPVYGIRHKETSLTAFINAKIIISPESTIENGILVIENGKVVKVGENLTVPEGAFVIDLKGYTIYPGFIDPFTEYGLGKTPKAKRLDYKKFKADRKGGCASNDAIHSEIDWVHIFKPDNKQSKELFQSGFTTVQSGRRDGILRGRSLIANLGSGLSNDLIISPYSSQFMSFNKGSSCQENPQSLMGSIALIRQLFYDIDWYQNAHRAFQNNSSQKMPEFNSAIEALVNYNKTYFFESDDALTMLRADNIAAEFDLDFVHIGSGYEYARIEEIKNRGLSLILPLNFPKAPEVAAFEDALDVTLAKLRHWESAPFNPAVMQDNGVNFALTTSFLKKKSDFLKNLREAIADGLSESQALKSLTTIPAMMCDISDKCGTLEKNKQANFFVTDGNIFKDSTQIYAVWVMGNKNQLKPYPEIDYRGKYSLKFDGFNADILINGTKTKLKGQLFVESDADSLEHLSIIDDKIQFTVQIETDNILGTVRFSGFKKDNQISGKCALPDGKIVNFTAEEIIETKSDDDKAANEKSETQDSTSNRIARTTSPNRSFGLSSSPSRQNILIQNVTIWTGEDDGVLTETDLLIKDGKIAQVGKDIKAPAGTEVYDGTGKHITAGVIDAHSHIAGSGNINECTDCITCETRISDIINPDDISIYNQLAGGVTSSHILHGSCNAIGGQCQLIKLKWGSNAEEIKFNEAPKTVKFALGENVKRSNWGDKYKTRYPVTRMGIEAIIRDEFQTAREYEKKWADYNKLGKKQKTKTIPPRKNLELEAVVDIINMKILIHCHSYVQSEILMLMRVAEDFNFHVQTFTHILEGYKVAPEMAAHGATASSFSDWWAYKFEVYDAIPYNVALMTEKGVLSSVNSDNGDLARRLNQEGAKSVMYGDMSEEEALKLFTINPAKQLKVDHLVGSIKEGKDADFVIWNGNPLSIYSKVEQTWIEGAKYFDIDRHWEIMKEDEIEKQALIQKVLSDKAKRSETEKDYKPEDKEWHCDDNFDYWRLINDEK